MFRLLACLACLLPLAAGRGFIPSTCVTFTTAFQRPPIAELPLSLLPGGIQFPDSPFANNAPVLLSQILSYPVDACAAFETLGIDPEAFTADYLAELERYNITNVDLSGLTGPACNRIGFVPTVRDGVNASAFFRTRTRGPFGGVVGGSDSPFSKVNFGNPYEFTSAELNLLFAGDNPQETAVGFSVGSGLFRGKSGYPSFPMDWKILFPPSAIPNQQSLGTFILTSKDFGEGHSTRYLRFNTTGDPAVAAIVSEEHYTFC